MFKIIKKADLTYAQALRLRLLAVLCALAASCVVIMLLGLNPIEVYAKLVEGSVMSAYRLQATIEKAIPLIMLSLGVAVAFKMKFWNIGAEGQFYLGAYGAALVALNFGKTQPRYIVIPCMMLAAMICGGAWAFIPAALKARFNTSETLVTLMLNYIAVRWISYLQYGPWRDPASLGFARVTRFEKAAILKDVFGVNTGWIIVLVAAALVHMLLKRSKLGYEIAVLGENDATARYCGMNTKGVMILAVMISGGLCGMAGMIQASAIENSISDQLSSGLGFTSVITAWLARLSAPGILIVSVLFAMLLQGGSYLQSSLKIPAAVAEIIQGTILFFVLSSDFFTQYSIVSKKKLSQKLAQQ